MMENVDLSDSSLNSNRKDILFKCVNFFISFLCVVSGLTELFTRFDYFFQGTLIILIGLLISYLEFKIPPKLFTYFSSFFSFLGRGAIYIILGILNLHGDFKRFLIGFIIIIVGLVYIGLEYSGIEPPKNMSGEMKWNDIETGDGTTTNFNDDDGFVI